MTFLIFILILWSDLTLAALGKRSLSYWLCFAGQCAWLWLACAWLNRGDQADQEEEEVRAA